MSKFKPQVRKGFSDRNGISPINNIVQTDSFDRRTRNAIMNFVDSIFFETAKHGSSNVEELYLMIYLEVFRTTKDDIPWYSYRDFDSVREPIYKGITEEWNYDDILTFLECFISYTNPKYYFEHDLYDLINNLFKTECVGYRFIDGFAVPIVDEHEIESIEEAINTKYSACNKCIEKALKYLFDREKPDYENSVKESISAIEAMCNIINGTSGDTLGEALNKLESNGVSIHGAMKSAFNTLYGYTSDKSGIRHNAGVDENTTFEEAQYMLVSCSAFLNYLIGFYEKTL